jgi:hypothetical protein
MGTLLWVLLVAGGGTVPAQPLDDSWTVTVNGQSVQVDSNGYYRIPNVSAADEFSTAGFGEPPIS